MSGYLNRAQLIGNLGADPESRTMRNGGLVVTLHENSRPVTIPNARVFRTTNEAPGSLSDLRRHRNNRDP
jgi:single-stranded DNA-binding protein